MTELVERAGAGDTARAEAVDDRLAHGTEEFAARRMDRSIVPRWPAAASTTCWRSSDAKPDDPHHRIAARGDLPAGAEIDAEPGKSICRNLLDHDIEIEHACELSCACTTCHVIVREGFGSLDPSDEDEDDLLDQAGADADLAPSCQAIVKDTPLVIEIPKYSINQVKEVQKK